MLAPNAKILPCTPEQDTRALIKLAKKFLKFSPYVALDSELLGAKRKQKLSVLNHKFFGITLDLRETEKLYPSKLELAKEIQHRLSALGLSSNIGVAPTFGGAWALSRYSQEEISVIKSIAELKKAVPTLPIEALRIPVEVISSLRELGIDYIAQIQDLPRKKLLKRFGYTLLLQLDRIFGQCEEATEHVQEEKLFEVERNFEEPLFNRKQIQKLLLLLFSELFLELARAGKKATSFSFALSGVDKQNRGFCAEKKVSLYAPIKDKQILQSLLDSLVEKIPFKGEVFSIKLRAYLTEDIKGEQEHFLANKEIAVSNQEKESLLNNFSLIIGKRNIQKVELHQTHIPEKSFQFVPLEKETISKGEKNNLSFDYPGYLFATPIKIKAISLLPDKPPVQISWKGCSLKVLESSGPERLSDEWWKNENREEREYFKIQDELGRWLWIYRNRGSLEWFLHGVWS